MKMLHVATTAWLHELLEHCKFHRAGAMESPRPTWERDKSFWEVLLLALQSHPTERLERLAEPLQKVA